MARKVKKTIKTIFKNEEEEFKTLLNDYRKKYLPSKYNQLELLDWLCSDEILHYMSITSRGDGKSFNYIGALAWLSYHLNFGTMLLVRHWSLMDKMAEMVFEIIRTVGMFDIENVGIQAKADYLTITIEGREVFIITNLNNASDLKQSSAVLRNYPVVLYDEFLTLGEDYVTNELAKLQTIIKSIDRMGKRPYIKRPKIIYLGNPVNFDSPILPALNIFYALQNQEINTIQQHGKTILELRRNDEVNEEKTTGYFEDSVDSDITGEFNFSNYRLADQQTYNKALTNGTLYKIRLEDKLSYVILESDNEYILSIEESKLDENYCIHLKDETATCEYLKPSFYKDSFIKRFQKGHFNFKDSFSRTFIEGNEDLQRLNFFKLNAVASTDHEDAYANIVRESWISRLAKIYEQ
ncbi:neck appendage [Streptococcus phage C1]|uniref:Neck appendage n=1 Tax=Streptococcus phage C1 TaxID=2907838 RepID=Q7Y3F6_BPSC1|nr:terminase [Streptococcus phage C1]AAP42305.1 neck appendage [Streptococcus phage C1]